MYDAITVKTDGRILRVAMNKQPTLDFIQQAVGGSIEMVPHFIKYERTASHSCLRQRGGPADDFELQHAGNAGVVVVSPWRAETLLASTLWRYTHRFANAQRLTQLLNNKN